MYDESRLPLNRVVAFVGPYISIASGALASWLLVHVHVLGLFHIQHDGLGTAIAQGLVFVVTAGVAWAGHSKWLQGHHIMLEQAAGAAAGFRPGAPVPAVAGVVPDVPPDGSVVNPEPGDAERTEILAAAVPTIAGVVQNGGSTANGGGNGNGGVATESTAAPESVVSDEQEFELAPVTGGYDEDDTDDGYVDAGDMPDSRTTPDNPEEL